ncbi:MAG: hypothetical protein P4L71_04825 [Acetobacteraceae bacterium]|nr:hypothetical protein [Acetobacteraceae bacterium]
MSGSDGILRAMIVCCCNALSDREVRAQVAPQEKTEFNADAGRCTPNTQMAQRGSQAVDNAFDLQAWLAEIQQQAELQPATSR